MAGKLRFDSVNDTVTIPSLTLATNCVQEIKFIHRSALNDRFLFAGFTSGNANRWYVGTFSNRIALRLGGTYLYSGAGNPLLVDGAEYTITLIRIGSTWQLLLDGVSLVTPTVTFTPQPLTRIGSDNTPTFFAKMDLSYFSYVDSDDASNNRYYDANLSGGTGSILPTTSGTNQGTLVNFPTDNSQWVDFPAGGTDQPVTSVNAQQLTEAVAALISSRQVAASVPAEQVTQVVTASVAVRQSVVSIPAQQLTESNLVTIAVTMGITSVDAEQQTQSVLAAVSVRQVVTAGVAEQITQAVTVNVGQGAGPQVVTSINAQQLTEAVTASASVKQVITALPAEQFTEVATAAIVMAQVVTSIPAEQITQCVVVEISQPGDSGTSQPVTAIQCEQITQAVIAHISNHQVITTLPSEQLTEAVTVSVPMSQKIQVIVAEQLTEAVTAGEALPPTFVAFNIKVTVLPSPFTIKDVTPIYKAYQ